MTQLSPLLDEKVRNEILSSLDLPVEAVPLFLEHISRFCHAHGGDVHYRDLLELLARFDFKEEQP